MRSEHSISAGLTKIGVLLIAISATLFVAAAIAIWNSRPLQSAEAIDSGKCPACIFEELVIERDGRATITRHIALRVTKGNRQELGTLFGLRRRHKSQQIVFERIASRRATLGSEAYVAMDVSRINACIAQMRSDCARFVPINALAKSRSLLLVKTKEYFAQGNLPGRNFSRQFSVPGGMFGPRFGARVIAYRDVFTDGDLQSSRAGTWTYEGNHNGYVAVSTLPTWDAMAKVYSGVEAHRLSSQWRPIGYRGSTGGARRSLEEAWAWSKTNLHYSAEVSEESMAEAPKSLEKIAEDRSADCKGYVLALKALLARDGIRSETVLVNTRNSALGTRSPLPVNRFDHVVLYIPALKKYVDPTLSSKWPVPTGGGHLYLRGLNVASGQFVDLTLNQSL